MGLFFAVDLVCGHVLGIPSQERAILLGLAVGRHAVREPVTRARLCRHPSSRGGRFCLGASWAPGTVLPESSTVLQVLRGIRVGPTHTLYPLNLAHTLPTGHSLSFHLAPPPSLVHLAESHPSFEAWPQCHRNPGAPVCDSSISTSTTWGCSACVSPIPGGMSPPSRTFSAVCSSLALRVINCTEMSVELVTFR